MADDAAPSGLTPGRETSEFALTKWIAIGAAILDIIAVILETLHGAGFLPDKPWAATALAAVATVMAVVKATGYTRSRTLQKLAELAPVAAQGAASTVPFARAVAEAVRELRAISTPAPELPPEPRTPSGPMLRSPR